MEGMDYDEVMERLTQLRNQFKDGLITPDEWELEVTGVLVAYSFYVRMIA